MILGSQVQAPEGYLCLKKGITYYFLQSDGLRNRVRLVSFFEGKRDVVANMVAVTRGEFESGLKQGDVKVVGTGDGYPPWLEPINGKTLEYLESKRVCNKESYDLRINKRLLAVYDLVERYDEIIASDDPDSEINLCAKKQGNNAARLRFWFYSYVVFGFNRWALMPRFHKIGNRGSDKPIREIKLGRPAKDGKKHGYVVTAEMKELIEKSYVAYRSARSSWNKIYGKVVTNAFGCVVLIFPDGTREFKHPEGKAFPSLWQFKYWVKKAFAARVLEKDRVGALSLREKSGSAGSFSASIMNICQVVEFDGYNISEKISGVAEGNPVDSYCVVRASCVLTGAVLGVGFAEGAENMEAYRMCLFSMATDKIRYGEFFAVTINEGEWPCIGLPSNVIFDRGPAKGMDISEEVSWLGTFEMPPTYSGQGKATVESSHPRDKKIKEPPSFKHSALNFVEMARREILQVLFDNNSSDASGRMENEMWEMGFLPTPTNIWRYYDGLFRNSAVCIPFEEAVRRFLTPHKVKVKRNAVYFYGRKYRSEELVSTGVFDRVARHGEISCIAYAITMCVRHIWLEFEGSLYELDAILTSNGSESGVDISLGDLKRIDCLRKEAQAKLRDQMPAIQQDYRNRFKEETGKDWDAGQRKQGRAKKTASAQRDSADYKRFIGKEK